MLKAKDIIRYERHVELEEIGETGQAKLLESRIVIIGAGGLGCPVSLYLCAAGIGEITIVDDDVVSLSNLQRQILYGTNEVGESKVDISFQKLSAINNNIKINPIAQRLTEDSASKIIQNHDLVIDGSDNFETRYLLNKKCHEHSKTLVSGSILRFDGQVSVFKSYDVKSPCYECLYPHKPLPHEVPSCTESAVIGPLPGVIGTMMAIETIKELLDIGESLAGSLVIYDGLRSNIQKIKFDKRTDCSVCTHGC